MCEPIVCAISTGSFATDTIFTNISQLSAHEEPSEVWVSSKSDDGGRRRVATERERRSAVLRVATPRILSRTKRNS